MKKFLVVVITAMLAFYFSGCDKFKEEQKPFERRGAVKMEPIDLNKDHSTDTKNKKK
jgi:hypothetical protein